MKIPPGLDFLGVPCYSFMKCLKFKIFKNTELYHYNLKFVIIVVGQFVHKVYPNFYVFAIK